MRQTGHRREKNTEGTKSAKLERPPQAHDGLETQVEKRTAELTKANEELRAENRAQRQVGEALRESEERYRRLVQLSPDAIAVHCEGRFVYVNPAALRLFGAESAEQLLGTPILDRVHPDYRKSVIERVRQIGREGKTAPTIEEKFIRLDGSALDVEVAATSISYEGKPAVLVIMRDISERKQVEAEREQLMDQLQKANEQLVLSTMRAQERAEEIDALIESMAEGVTIANGEGVLVRINRAGKKIWAQAGWERAPGMPVDQLKAELFYPNGRPLSRDDWPIRRAVRGEVFSEQELVFNASSGRRIRLLFAGSSIRDNAGRVRMAIVVYRDITQIRELEQQREEFVSIVAHDLRGALTSIKGYADLLARSTTKEALPPFVQRGLDGIATGSRRLERMISDLLDVSRIEARRLTLDKEMADLPWLIKDIVQRAEQVTKEHPVRVEVHGEIPPVDVDPDRIEQVMTNLLSNAHKYSYPESEITVEIERRPHEVVVSVTNLGPGILPEDRERIFTRFHRTRLAVEEGVPGLSLGLYIARGLVEAHGGRIWVESKPGEYATFRFSLPTA